MADVKRLENTDLDWFIKTVLGDLEYRSEEREKIITAAIESSYIQGWTDCLDNTVGKAWFNKTNRFPETPMIHYQKAVNSHRVASEEGNDGNQE